MTRAISWLKDRFGLNKKPTVQDWVDLIDSFVHISQQQAVNAQVVNQAINAALAGLTARNSDGVVNSLGDMFFVMEGYNESQNLAQRLTALATAARWGTLPGKPAQVPLRWTEQIVNVAYGFNFQTQLAPNRQAWVLAELALLTGPAVILDLNIRRVFQPFNDQVINFTQGYMIDTIASVKIGINPNVSLV